tara:strand:+ start:2081 stop:2278 length:198 start_codon:yes stop_codon:yes gene_type:complete
MTGAKSDEEIAIEVYMRLYLNSVATGVGNELDIGVKVTNRFLRIINRRLQVLLKRMYYKKNSLSV